MEKQPPYLEACPCCGGKASVCYWGDGEGQPPPQLVSGDDYLVRCTVCGLSTEDQKDEATAVAIWNKRTP